MVYQFVRMNEEYVNKIKTWKYEDEYSIYSYDNDTSISEPENWDYIFAVLDENKELVAEITFYQNEEDSTCYKDDFFYGQGMRPDLVGKGLGKDLIKQSIIFGVKHFNYKKRFIYLDVLTFNKRAYKAYIKAGFELLYDYHEVYQGTDYHFNRMRINVEHLLE